LIKCGMDRRPYINTTDRLSMNNVLGACLLLSFFVILNRNPLSFVFKQHSVYLGYVFINFGFYILMTVVLVRNRIVKFNCIDRTLLCYLLFLSIRAVCMPEMFRSIVGFALYTGAVPVYFIVRSVKFKGTTLIAIMSCAFIYLISSASIEAAFWVQLGTTRVHVSRLAFFPHRLASTLGSSNHLSIFLPGLAILLTGYLLGRRSKRYQLYALALNVITLFVVIGTSSRGGLLTYLISLTLLWLFQRFHIQRKKSYNLVFVGCIFILALLPLWFFCLQKSELYSFLSSISDPNELGNSIRLIKYKAIINSLGSDLRTLLFGIGIGYTGSVVHLAGLPTYFQLRHIGEYYGTESSLLKVLLETGICGFILFSLLLLRSIYFSYVLLLRSANRVEKGIYLGILFFLILVVLRSVILQVFDIPVVLLFTWGSMGYLSKALSREHLNCKTPVKNSRYV